MDFCGETSIFIYNGLISLIRGCLILVTNQYFTCEVGDINDPLRYSNNTIRNYSAAFEEFINFHHTFDIDKITEPKIVAFIRYLVTDCRVSTSNLNLAINAIKFYYEKVLQGQRKFYYVARPIKEKMLPLVLSVEEIKAMFKVVTNTKHKLILMLLYASGLSMSEVTDLKISDIDTDQCKSGWCMAKGRKIVTHDYRRR